MEQSLFPMPCNGSLEKGNKTLFQALAPFRNYPHNPSSQLQEYLINTGKIQDVGSDYA